VRHRAKKGRGSLLSWNRASVVLAGIVVLCLLCLPGAVAWAQEETTEAADVVTNTATEIDDASDAVVEAADADAVDLDEESVYYDHVGWYVRGGVFGGFLEGRKGVDFDPGIGFSVAGGLRHNRWMAIEVNYSKVYESKTNDIEPKNTRSVEEYEVGVDLHFYPLGLIEVLAVSDRFQPYVSGGFGFSEVDVSSSKQTLYMLRIGGGLDVYVTEKLGIYVDGSYSIMSGTTIGNQNNVLSGRGSIGWGAFARF
jgi:opacity protein-like surface antigen